MKRMIFATLLFVGAGFAGAEILDIRPEDAPAKAAPMAVEWQLHNKRKLAAATADAELAKAVSSAEAAKELLSGIRGAYVGDALLMHKIAAVTQWVMAPGEVLAKRAKVRRVWVDALKDCLKNASDEYVKTFCLDQLRWCAAPGDAAEIVAVCAKSSKAVKDFAAVVDRELKAVRP